MQDGTLKPLPGAIAPDIDLENRWKSVQYRTAEIRIASHVPAYESRNSTAAASPQRTQVARFDLGRNCVVRKWSGCASAAGHVVLVRVRKNDDVPGCQLDGGSIDQLHPCSTIDNEMVEHRVFRTWCEFVHDDATRRR